MLSKNIKRVLVTGGAGFIGSHLCERLIAEGRKVICLDNLITGSRQNIGRLKRHKNFVFVQRDLCEPLNITGPIDAILNAASPASPVDYIEHPLETLEVGSTGTRRALELARQKKAVFIQFSTSEVYGDPQFSPQSEAYWGNVNPVGPRSVYDEAKRFSEALTMAYHRQYGVNVKIIRIFNTYGPRMRLNDGRVVPNFIRQALTGRPLTVYGNGRQTRSYCYVDDLVEGILRMIDHKKTGPVNLGNPNELEVIGLAKVVLKLTGSKSRLVRKPLPVDDPKQRCPDIRLARRSLSWKPKVGLNEGLKRTIAYFREKI